MRPLEDFARIENELKEMFVKRFFDEVIGMTDPQVNYLEREKEGMTKTERDLLFISENSELWNKMLSEDMGTPESDIYKAYVILFGAPNGLNINPGVYVIPPQPE